MTAIRGDRRGDGGSEYGLRMWENDDLVPCPDDVFQERLYCIRYIHTRIDEDDKERQERYYVAPSRGDLDRERRVLELLQERFHEWQKKGLVPSRQIELGDETTRLMRERGWTHWHHLFNPRQLLLNGLLSNAVTYTRTANGLEAAVAVLLGLGRCLNFNSRLTRWVANAANEKGADTFNNQALNTLLVYVTRLLPTLSTLIDEAVPAYPIRDARVSVPDARLEVPSCDIWLTDPPDADAINYHELSEYFLAWYERHIASLFPAWYQDSRRALAIRGSGEDFRQGMVESYRNLTVSMPANGFQVVMFTHQDASVWADLALSYGLPG
ncbi:MAG: hypothetical protein ACREUQ_16010 [Burkholderiales bacterium]